MHDDLVRLRQMDTHDRNAASASKAARALRDDRRAREQALSDAEAHLAQIKADAQSLRTAELTAQRDLERARTYQTRARRALEGGLGDADAAQRQLDQTTVQIDDLETQLLEHMESGDAMVERRASAESAIGDAKAHLAELLERYDGELAAYIAEEAQQAAEVRSIALLLPPELRGRYEDLRARRQWAVAVVREGACNACNKVVTQQHISDLRRGLMKACMGCHRFLVVPESAD